MVGRIVKPHGLKGEVLVRVLSDNPQRFDPGSELLVGRDPGSSRTMKVESSRTNQARMLVQLAGCFCLEEAETLREQLIFVPAGALGKLEEDEFYFHELMGLAVHHKDGTVLGEITDVLDRLAQDLWVIRTSTGEVLFPAAKPLVVSVDTKNRVVVIDPPEGLFA